MIDNYNTNHEKRNYAIHHEYLFWTSLIAQRIYMILIISILFQQLWILYIISYILIQQIYNILYLWYRYHIELPDNQLPFRIISYYKQKLYYNSFKYIFGSNKSNNQTLNDIDDTLNMMSVLQDIKNMKRYGKVSYIYFLMKYQTRVLCHQFHFTKYERYEQILLLQQRILQYDIDCKKSISYESMKNNNLYYIIPKNKIQQPITKLPSLIIPLKTTNTTTNTTTPPPTTSSIPSTAPTSTKQWFSGQ